MKQNDLLNLTVEANGSDGAGIAHTDGFCVFVPYALEGEICSVKVDFVNQKKKIAFAHLTEMPTSSNRVKPSCPYFYRCGGCVWQNADYSFQLTQKGKIVKNNLRKLGKLTVENVEVVPSPLVYGYRNKIALPVGGKKGDVKIGLYKTNTHEVIDVKKGCALCGDWAQKVSDVCRAFFNERGLEPFDEQSGKGCIRHVVARYLDGQLLVNVVHQSGASLDLRPLADKIAKEFPSFGLFENINDTKTNVILSGKSRRVAGIKAIESSAFGVTYYLRPDSFFQVNTGAKDLLYAEAKRLVSEINTDVLFDCFSGSGLLTAALYSSAYDTVAVEIEPSATEDADNMKQANNLVRLTNVCGDVTVELPKLMKKLQPKQMHLCCGAFEQIKRKTKKFELRLFDEKRSTLTVGDRIVFENNLTHEKLGAEVASLQRFSSWQEVFSAFDKIELGCSADCAKEEFLRSMAAYYTAEQVEKYGVVVIGLKDVGEKLKKNVTLVVDPPRKGLDEKIISTIADNDVKNVVYISCDSATLSRDLARFAALGYTLSHLKCFDLFPHTPHIETLVCLARK